jgi:hypothetical protein
MNYTRRSERHAWALLKRMLLRVPHKRILGTYWMGYGRVGAVFNARGLVCGWVNRGRKFTRRGHE